MAESAADEVRSIGNAWLAEAAHLRAVRPSPDDDSPPALADPDAAPPDIHEALVTARGCLDRLEAILAQALAMSSAARIRAADLAGRADDELNQAIASRAARAREFEAAAERIASANVDALKFRREARSAQKIADMAASIERRIRLQYYGLAGVREDLARRLSHAAWEANNDR